MYLTVIPLLGIHLKEPKTVIQKHISTPVFMVTLFIVAKRWKQPKCLSVDEWIKQLWDIYRMEFYWTIKGKKMFLFVTVWIDLESIMLSEIRQRKTSTK